MITVALVGPDGAGKSTIGKQLIDVLPFPTAYVYMGVNLESSNLVLPSTRLILQIKRSRGGRPDMTASFLAPSNVRATMRSTRRVLLGIKALLRLANLLAEEWFRQFVIWTHKMRGRVVVLDRHFYVDYYIARQAFGTSSEPLAGRIHTWLLTHTYPRPDLVVCLDAPAKVLLSRKGEGTLESLESRRRAYLSLAGHVPRFERVDATLPAEEVLDAVAAIIMGRLKAEPGTRSHLGSPPG